MKRTATAAAAMALLGTLWACAPEAGNSGSAGMGQASDASTVQLVEQKIKADPSLSAADVKVSEQNGTIMLDGTVGSVQDKDKAEAAVLAVQKEKGLQTGVLNNLMVEEQGAPSGG